MRAVLSVEEDRRGRTTLVVTELPSQVNPIDLAEKIADLVKEGTVGGIAEVRDEGSGPAERIVIVLKRDAVTKVVLNNLCQHTQLEPGSAG
jgi:DNA gyrase subunit A